MRRDYVNPKKKIRKHLAKRKTSYDKLYLVFIMAVLFVGVLTVVLQTNWSSEASESVGNNIDNQMMVEAEPEIENSKESKITEQNIIIEDEENDGLFPKTKNEVLLEEMIKKEEINLTAREKQYFENN